MMALPESGSTRPPIYAPWRRRQGHLRPDCERLYITSATPGRSRDTAHHAGAVHSPWAARPTGRMAGYRCACREGDPSLIGLPSRSSRRKAASRTGAKAGVPEGTRRRVDDADQGSRAARGVTAQAYTTRATARVALGLLACQRCAGDRYSESSPTVSGCSSRRYD